MMNAGEVYRLSKAKDIYIKPHRQESTRPCRHLWLAVRRFLGWVGHDRLPEFAKVIVSVAKPAGRVTFQSEPYPVPVEGCGVLTVLSANLWHDWPRFRGLERRLESFAELVEAERVDLVLLQEVARTPSLKSDAWLAQRLQMAHVYSRANGSRKIGFEEGLGVFSRFPLKRLPHIQQMGRSCNPFSRRLALGVEVDTPCGEIMAFSTHLGLMRKQNAAQVYELHNWISRIALGRSAIIAGDFNAPEHTHQMTRIRSYWQDTFREIHAHGHAATHEIRWPWGGVFLSHRLDYIFLQPGEPAWQVVAVKHLDAPGGPHSDHRAVLARLAPSHLMA
jgi:endonuclease/exonuclease/phosphatase family metal-dependent hydrolase